MQSSTTSTSIVGNVEHAIDLRTGDVWIRLDAEPSGLTSVLFKTAKLGLLRGTRLVCIGEWARSDSDERLFLADVVKVASRSVRMPPALATQTAGEFSVRPGSAIDLRVRKDLETLFGSTENVG